MTVSWIGALCSALRAFAELILAGALLAACVVLAGMAWIAVAALIDRRRLASRGRGEDGDA